MDALTMQITASVISDLATKFTSFFISKCGKYFKDKKAHNEIIVQSAYEKYLTSTKEKYEKVKTLLYKQAPQNLYDFYECLGVKHKNTIIDTSSINNVLKIGHKLIISGTGGIGKTIMMKHLFLSCIRDTDCIPIFIELRSLNEEAPDDINIFDAIYQNLRMFNFELEREYFDYSLGLGKYVFIFDGYDEVKSNLAKKIADCIFQLSNKYPSNYFIISSRPLNNFVSWSDFIEVKAQGLTKSQALSLVKKLKYDDKIKEKFYQALDDELYEKYKTFAVNPLLLTIMLMTFTENGEIPENFNDFYEQAFLALYKSHDASKGAYVRDKATKLSFNDFKLIFSHVCFKSFFNCQYEFNDSQLLDLIDQAKLKCPNVEEFESEDFLKDLTESVCMLVREGLNLRFTHRSFQEYFAAFYTTQLDDHLQEKLVKVWLNEYGFFDTSEYLNILSQMEPERFEKNILLPGLKEIKKAEESPDEQKIFDLFFGDISFGKPDIITLTVRNHYFFSMYKILIGRLRRGSKKKSTSKNKGAFYKALVEKGLVKDDPRGNITLSTDIIYSDPDLIKLFKSEFSMVFDAYHLGMEILEDYQKSPKNHRPKKLISFIADL